MASPCRRCRREPSWCTCTAAELKAWDDEARQTREADQERSPSGDQVIAETLLRSAKFGAACAAAVAVLTVAAGRIGSGASSGALAALGVVALVVLGGPVAAVGGLILAAVKRDAQLAWAVVGAVAGFCVAWVIVMMMFAAI